MFDGVIVKKKFPFKKILDLENFWSKTKLENFHQFSFFFFFFFFFFCKKPWNVMFDGEIVKKKIPFKKNFVSLFLFVLDLSMLIITKLSV